MTYNRANIFTLAWAWAKQDLWSRRLPASQLCRLFRAALVRAWAEAKANAARVVAPSRFSAMTADQLRSAIVSRENTDRLGWAGIQELGELCRELADRDAFNPAQAA